MQRATRAGALRTVSLLGALAIASQVSDAQRPVTEAPRFPVLTMEQLNDRQKEVAERVLKVSSAGRRTSTRWRF